MHFACRWHDPLVRARVRSATGVYKDFRGIKISVAALKLVLAEYCTMVHCTRTRGWKEEKLATSVLKPPGHFETPPHVHLHPPLASSSCPRAERTPPPLGRSPVGAGPPPRSLAPRRGAKSPLSTSSHAFSNLKWPNAAKNALIPMVRNAIFFRLRRKIRKNESCGDRSKAYFLLFATLRAGARKLEENFGLDPTETPPSLLLCPWLGADPPFARSFSCKL